MSDQCRYTCTVRPSTWLKWFYIALCLTPSQISFSISFLPVAYLGFGKGGHGERAEREPITGALGQRPQRGLGAESP